MRDRELLMLRHSTVILPPLRGTPLCAASVQDLRYVVRMLLQNKLWTLMVVISLALGIGANTALFSAVFAVMLKKLSVPDPDSLVRFAHVGPTDMATIHKGALMALGVEQMRQLRELLFQEE